MPTFLLNIDEAHNNVKERLYVASDILEHHIQIAINFLQQLGYHVKSINQSIEGNKNYLTEYEDKDEKEYEDKGKKVHLRVNPHSTLHDRSCLPSRNRMTSGKLSIMYDSVYTDRSFILNDRGTFITALLKLIDSAIQYEDQQIKKYSPSHSAHQGGFEIIRKLEGFKNNIFMARLNLKSELAHAGCFEAMIRACEKIYPETQKSQNLDVMMDLAEMYKRLINSSYLHFSGEKGHEIQVGLFSRSDLLQSRKEFTQFLDSVVGAVNHINLEPNTRKAVKNSLNAAKKMFYLKCDVGFNYPTLNSHSYSQAKHAVERGLTNVSVGSGVLSLSLGALAIPTAGATAIPATLFGLISAVTGIPVAVLKVGEAIGNGVKYGVAPTHGESFTMIMLPTALLASAAKIALQTTLPGVGLMIKGSVSTTKEMLRGLGIKAAAIAQEQEEQVKTVVLNTHYPSIFVSPDSSLNMPNNKERTITSSSQIIEVDDDAFTDADSCTL